MGSGVYISRNVPGDSTVGNMQVKLESLLFLVLSEKTNLLNLSFGDTAV